MPANSLDSCVRFKNSITSRAFCLIFISCLFTNFGLNKADKIKEKLQEIKEKDNLKGIFFSIIDILNEESYTFTSGNEENKIFTKIFNAEEKEDSLFVKNLVSRKKQIVPKFQEYFK